MTEPAISAAETTAEDEYSEVSDSVAYSLIEDLVRNKKIPPADAEFLRAKYKRLYDSMNKLKVKDEDLSKKCRALATDVLSEKLAFEKVRIEEAEELQKLRKLEHERDAMEKEVDFNGQRDTMAKFELAELRKVHEELHESLDRMKKENRNMVEPVLNGLQQEIKDCNRLLAEADDAYEKESEQKKALLERVAELEAIKAKRLAEQTSLVEALDKAKNEPSRLSRQVESIDRAANSMDAELKSIQRKIKNADLEMEKQTKRIQDAEKLQLSLTEKLTYHRQTLEQREHDVNIIRTRLETEKAKHHDLLTRKVELNSKIKEMETGVRHKHDQSNFLRKEYESLKRQYKKKVGIVDSIKQVLPQLQEQLIDQQHTVRQYKEQSSELKKTIQELKDELDNQIAQLLQQEGLEKSKKEELELMISEVDELEGEVVQWMAEQKRQSKLISVLSAQRDIKARECARVEQKEKDARQHVRMKELVILDLTKRCNEISNRLKEFSALYEVVKNERNKYVNLIQSSTQALAEMREKIRILHNEVEILRTESTAKDKALVKERTAHQQAQTQRDSLRQEMNKLLSEYRQKQSVVEQQIQEIDKLNLVINSLEKDMLELKSRYERAVEERNVTGVQLIDRNDELCILYERSNQQQEALKKGELELRRKDEEVRMVRLQIEEINRQFHAARKKLPEIDTLLTKAAELEDQLAVERRKTDTLSAKLEDPQNTDRWRPLDGNDPDLDQLLAKTAVLEDRLNEKREHLLEKELVLEEVTALTERLREQALGRRENAKAMADQLNDLQSRIRDTTKKMLASVSELSMYQAMALKLQQEKFAHEKTYEDAKWRYDHGEAPTEDAVKDLDRAERRRLHEAEAAMRREEELQMVQSMGAFKSTAEPRPTAYIPDDLGIPKPYGSLAPFKPSELGSSMRHIRMPNPKPIEI